MSSVFLRLIRSAVVTAIGAWLSSKQNDPRYLAVIPPIHAAFKWLRDRYPKNPVLEYFPF